jgi:hypothetical protein
MRHSFRRCSQQRKQLYTPAVSEQVRIIAKPIHMKLAFILRRILVLTLRRFYRLLTLGLKRQNFASACLL